MNNKIYPQHTRICIVPVEFPEFDLDSCNIDLGLPVKKKIVKVEVVDLKPKVNNKNEYALF